MRRRGKYAGVLAAVLALVGSLALAASSLDSGILARPSHPSTYGAALGRSLVVDLSVDNLTALCSPLTGFARTAWWLVSGGPFVLPFPEPGGMLILATGLFGLAAAARARHRRRQG